MALLIKAAAAGVTAALVALTLKKTNPEMSLLLTLASGTFILVLAMELYAGAADVVTLVSDSGVAPELLTPVLKCVAVGIICRFASDICKDAGAAAVASSVEVAGAAAALFLALPLFRTLLALIGGLL